jgi:hypothetical protein
MPASPPFPPNVKPIVLMLLEFKSQHSKNKMTPKQNEARQNEKDVADLLRAQMRAQTYGRASAIIAHQSTSSAIKLRLLPYSAGVGRVSSMRAGMLVVSKTIAAKLFWQRTQYGGAFAS